MTVNKALSIVALFNMDRKILTVDEIASLISLPKSSAYRHIRVLKENGYLVEHSTGTYKLGYIFLGFANIVRSDISIAEVAHPIMNDLTKEFDETTILSVLSDVNAVCLATTTPNQPIKVSSEEGQILPLFSGASSKVILAYQDPKLVDKIIESGNIKRFTKNTITDKDGILEELASVRTRGYAKSLGEVDEGVMSLGFPIRNAKGNVFASLSIAGPEYRMVEKVEQSIVHKYQQAVKTIEGYF